MWFYHREMHPTDADGMANSIDPDHTAGSALCAQTYSVPKLLTFTVWTILTHLVYITNGKKSCSVLQQFTGRKSVTLLGATL